MTHSDLARELDRSVLYKKEVVPGKFVRMGFCVHLGAVICTYVFMMLMNLQISQSIIPGESVYLGKMLSLKPGLLFFSFAFKPRFPKCGFQLTGKSDSPKKRFFVRSRRAQPCRRCLERVVTGPIPGTGFTLRKASMVSFLLG